MNSIKIDGGDIQSVNDFDGTISLHVTIPTGKHTVVIECDSDLPAGVGVMSDHETPVETDVIAECEAKWKCDAFTLRDSSRDEVKITRFSDASCLSFRCIDDDNDLVFAELARPQAAVLWKIFKRFAETGEFGPEQST